MKIPTKFSSILLPAMGLLLGLVSLNAQALDSRTQNACYHAFAGKCFHAGDAPLDVSQLLTPSDAQAWCGSNPNYCSPAECVARVEVLASIIAGGQQDPCLPDSP
jgi:hypothetical protein